MRAFAIAVLIGLGLVVVSSTTASAATITEPSGKTIEVGRRRPRDTRPRSPSRRAASSRTRASSSSSATAVGQRMTMDVTVDCDLGSSPAAAVADEHGVATFAADDPNHALVPLRRPGSAGRSSTAWPRGGASPGNGMDDFTQLPAAGVDQQHRGHRRSGLRDARSCPRVRRPAGARPRSRSRRPPVSRRVARSSPPMAAPTDAAADGSKAAANEATGTTSDPSEPGLVVRRLPGAARRRSRSWSWRWRRGPASPQASVRAGCGLNRLAPTRHSNHCTTSTSENQLT